jgi:Tol biopolymer transport system component
VLVQSIVWTPDGKSLIYTYTAPVLGSDGRYLSSLKELQRLDVTSRERATLIKDGQDPGFSPAGGATPFSYVMVTTDTFEPSLWVANGDGQQGRRVVGPEAKFLSISGPRFSPDGKTIIFAASGGPPLPGQPAPSAPPGGSLPGRIARWFVAPFFPASVAAHGPPADLWAISSDGSNLRRLTQLNGDDMLPAWSPDGRRIAFLTGTGLFIMNADGSGIAKISDRGSYSSLIWTTR